MDDKQKIEQLKQEGWEDMSAMLDKHMPADRDRGIVWWYWPAGAAAVLLAVILAWALLQDPGTPEGPVHSSPGQMITQEKSGKSDFDDEAGQRTSSHSSETDAVHKSPLKDDLAKAPVEENHQADPREDQQRNTFLAAREEKEADNKKHGIADAETNPVISSDGSKELAGSAFISGTRMIHSLDIPSFLITPVGRNIPFLKAADLPEMVISDRKGHFTGLVFSELMGSFSDAFGFVNAGPGLQYKTGKWSMGLSAGVSLPLPEQKAFASSNRAFSNQYNFDYAADSKVESSSHGFNSSSPVYYERYSMNPGWMMNISAEYHFTHRWDVSADIGRIGFRYDFTQRAEPNAQLAASTDLANLRNSLWYGGLSISYLLGEHWKLYGGARMINLLGAGDVGFLPAVRLAYRF